MLTHWKKSITGHRVKAVVQSDGNTVADSAARGNDIQMVPVVCKLCLTPCHVDQMYILEHCRCSFCVEVVFVISVIIACWFPVLFFAARCYASAVLAMALCPSVCLSVCPSQVGVLLKRLNVGSHKQHHTIAQGL